MNQPNGSLPSSQNGVAKGIVALTRDIASLAAMQIELLQEDCREGLKRMLIPAVMLLAAGILAVCTVPIALILIAELLVQSVGLSRPLAFAIAVLIGITVSAAIGVVGWIYIRRVARLFHRSGDEWARNRTWIRRAVKWPTPIDPPPPQDRAYFSEP